MDPQREELQQLKVAEAAEILGCRERHVWDMIYRREIDSVIVGRRLRRVPLSAVRALIEKGKVPALQQSA